MSMTRYILKDAVKALVDAKLLKAEDTDRAQAALETAYEDSILERWTVVDVLSVKNMSKGKAREVLATLEHRYDASLGINWDVISATING